MRYRIVFLFLLPVLGLLAPTGASAQISPAEAAIQSQGTETVLDWNKRFREYTEEVFNQGKLERGAEEYWAPEFTNHYAPAGLPKGAEGVALQIEGWLKAFPDTRITVDDLVISGNRIVARVTIQGTHKGEFMGIAPTGRAITVSGIAWYQFREDRLTDIWPVIDVAKLLEQLK